MSRTATVFLKPGELFFSDRPTVVSTLLGSCVAVTMYSPRMRIGAICHALLPVCRKEKESCCELTEEGGRYVECCVKLMLEGMEARGVARREIVSKVFGGANMFDVASGKSSVGKQNVEKALKLLEEAGVRVASSDVGGGHGRKIFFDTHTGAVFLKHLSRVNEVA